jgi:hypothetical protein
MVRMIGAGCFKKFLKVIGELSHLAPKIMLSSGDELLIRVTSVLVVITFITAGCDRDSLGLPLRPLLSFLVPLFAPFVGCHCQRLTTAAWGCLLTTLHENGPDRFLARGVPGANVEELLRGLLLVITGIVHQRLAVCAGPEC